MHDTTTVKTVNVAAIYGREETEPHNTTVSCDGMLEAFTIDSAEIDRMEGQFNDLVDTPSESSSSDDLSEAEEQTAALGRLKKKQLHSRKNYKYPQENNRQR